MKNYVITKKRDGQEEKFFGYIYDDKFSEAKKQFIKDMSSDLFLKNEKEYENFFIDENYENVDKLTFSDECGNEVWGFRDNGKIFSEDVYTYSLKNLKESKNFI